MAQLLVLVFGIVGLWTQVDCLANNKYDDYSLVRIYPANETQVEAVNRFQDHEDTIEVLKGSRGINDSLDLLVAPNRINYARQFADENNLGFEVKQQEYGRTFKSVERVPRRRVLRSFSIYDYNSFSAIQEYLETVARRRPELVTLQILGNSYQGRRVKLAKISTNPNAGNPIIFIDAGIHAREWVAPAMALYLIHRLTNDPDARQNELNGVDWYILPVVNPDGYEFTRSSKANRLWRKTRSKSNGNCYGVDGNRNYGFKWAVSGVSNNPCDRETYAGPQPFSEPETQMVRNVMLENAKRLKLYVSVHSYGQYLVYPWGYTGDYIPKEWKKLDSLARSVSDAVQRAGGKPFRVMSAGKWYPAAGGSDDYAFGAVGVPYSYTMELTDGYEFVFPERLLKVVLPQFYEGFRVFGAQIKKEFKNSRVPRDSDTNDNED
ncbi:carboxypeptidase B-like [Galleria mellonella]|uniref:Carboxypeptidase B-like n=1 Tax=Galleria mellonella TaxID=7137 RepID=A0A6J1X2F1_GALME|nr:carboxypeptidase B-like [Galleria mellonella]